MRRLGLVLGAAFLFAGLAHLASRRYARVAVTGHSMEPGLRDGDWLVLDRVTKPRPGAVAVARDPRVVGRIIVKRVGEMGTDSHVVLVSDHPAHAHERIGPVAAADVLGVVVFRYWPASRIRPPNRAHRSSRRVSPSATESGQAATRR